MVDKFANACAQPSRTEAMAVTVARRLPLSSDQRQSLSRAGALALDASGHEVLLGLTAAQSAAYLAFVRRPTRRLKPREQHQALTLQLERARLRCAAEAPDRDLRALTQAAIHDV